LDEEKRHHDQLRKEHVERHGDTFEKYESHGLEKVRRIEKY
jgi:hypothetical protein